MFSPQYRIVVAGDIGTYVVKDSPGVFRFDLEYNLNTDHVGDVSDHYPVQFQLEGDGPTGGVVAMVTTTWLFVLLVQFVGLIM